MLPAFGWQAVVTQWQFAPVVTAAAAAGAVLYLWGVRRVARRHPARPWPVWRTGMFFAAVAVVVLATESGIGAYDDVLFWDHMIQHLMLIMVAPALLVAAQPVTLLLHASRNPLHTWAKRVIRSRVAGFLTWPPFGLVAYAVTIVVTHLTGLMNLILANPAVHDAEHVTYLVVGYLFFMPLLGREPIRWRVPYPVRLLFLILAMPVDTITGLVLGYKATPFVFVGPRPPGAPTPLNDVHLGGAVMWIGGDAIMLVFMMVVVLMWSTNEGAEAHGLGWLEAARRANFDTLVTQAPAARASAPGTATEQERAARTERPTRRTIDDDEHLAAYNAYLARLHGPGQAPSAGPDSAVPPAPQPPD